MFAVGFDDFKRRVERNNPELEVRKLCTAFTNTPDFAAYWSVHESGVNPALHIHMEEQPPNLATYFILLGEGKPITMSALVKEVKNAE